MKNLYLLIILVTGFPGIGFTQSNLLITGVIDGPLSGGTPKAIELYALDDISDLSIYGVGSANNGQGSDGEEFTFPAINLSAGDFIYVASDSMMFNAFFGFFPQFVDGAANINGDDAIELFQNGSVVDVFGDINTDGTGEDWEHLDGWVYRVNGTGPDGNNFEIANWYFSGVDALDGETLNSTASKPFPQGTYNPGGMNVLDARDDEGDVEEGDCVDIDVLANDFVPGIVVDIEIIDQDGMLNEAGVQPDNSIRYCATDTGCDYNGFVTYVVTDDNGDMDTATVTITVICPTTYPLYDIELITTVDSDGLPDSIDVECSVIGVVHGVNLFEGGLQFALIDNDNNGITVFEFNQVGGYTPTEGDELIVKGSVGQFNGLTQFRPDSINVLSTGNATVTPRVVTTLDESIESSLITLEGVQIIDVDDWTGMGTGFNVDLTDGNNTYVMRIDDLVDLFSMSAPAGTFNVTGIGSQFDDSGTPYDTGYQILPRYAADIDIQTSVFSPESKVADMKVNPNPVEQVLRIQNVEFLDWLEVKDINGHSYPVSWNRQNNAVNVQHLPAGTYIISGMSANALYRSLFVKI